MKDSRVDILLAEIGSTTTVVNAFADLDGSEPRFLGQGQSHTSVLEGDVALGLNQAKADLLEKIGPYDLDQADFLACSSAAGGLRMTVHGLVYDMTVRAAREAALGSGGVIQMVTAGRLRRSDIQRIAELKPKILFLAGGTDYGERDTALYNYRALMAELPDLPLIYAGNIENQEELKLLAREGGHQVYFCENVYPALDQLNIEPARHLVHQVFEQHIVESPGMDRLREIVSGHILPTPGAVMEATLMAAEVLGDVLVFDVGGATTDLHSATQGSPNIQAIQSQVEPFAKRTVEGDLGLYVNRASLVSQFTCEERAKLIPQAEFFLTHASEIPASQEEAEFLGQLTAKACSLALARHAGKLVNLYGPTGRQTVAKGKDLSQIKYVIGTGGALTRLPQGQAILNQAFKAQKGDGLLPVEQPTFLLDRDYIMAALGVLSKSHPRAAKILLLKSLGLEVGPELRA